MHNCAMITKEDILRIRIGLGEKQGPFGRRFGVTQTTISRWEKFGVPGDLLTQMAIAQVLGSLAIKEAAE